MSVVAIADNSDCSFLIELAARFDLAHSAVHRMLLALIDREDPATRLDTLSPRIATPGFRFLKARHLHDRAASPPSRMAG